MFLFLTDYLTTGNEKTYLNTICFLFQERDDLYINVPTLSPGTHSN